MLQPIQLSVMGALAQALDGTVTNTAGTRACSLPGSKTTFDHAMCGVSVNGVSSGVENENFACETSRTLERPSTAKATRSPAAESTPDGTTVFFGAVWP